MFELSDNALIAFTVLFAVVDALLVGFVAAVFFF